MKLVAFPNTPQKQVFAVTGPSATFGSSPDNPIYLEGPNVSDYQASLTYADGVWLLESLDESACRVQFALNIDGGGLLAAVALFYLVVF